MSKTAQKRLLFLGANHFQIPPLEYARRRGYYIVTCDYLPENPGHSLGDEYHNISTVEKDKVLELAQELNINGVISYASDPSAPTAAYVAEQMGLSPNPFESVNILANKNLFRDFQKQHGFSIPKAKSFKNILLAKDFFDSISKPVMVKPVDSSGSKGVSKIINEKELGSAFVYALQYSRSSTVLLEEFVEKKGYQIAGDGFVLNGKLAFKCLANEHFNQYCNPLVPIGESFPSVLSNKIQTKIHKEIQRLIDLLGFQHGPLNFDILVDSAENIYLLEVGPRNGGNLIPQVIKHATNIDLVEATVEAALGNTHLNISESNSSGFFSSYMIHSELDGAFERIDISDQLAKNIVEKSLFVEPGHLVKRFDGSHYTYGTMILKFSTMDEMLQKMDNIRDFIKLVTK